ncbi:MULTISPECIES: alpha/beta hydrolase [unclassified Novosphingobium]|uniref:alpha/beta hydrolase n=1 Tax=unclassified Novosphingobium TaxID=2644732 RepID=UPI000D32225C|nr:MULTISPECIES: alpha/beta hydrolase [unclassified Novosphingobium]PTR11404.1 acetyl esterase/lipase [Novosphingobium sp. GV055]PUB04185.1 acetyl esterase/lipase [Novosphingobium sp. GV061]PUB20576.1 acetyl esterase/lipase [Novosphingobium sp. GV079]PUB42302.1 acetyl esterase/lipase [Novosphingobium sp. GV027]
MPFDATRAAIAAMGTTLTPDLLGQVRALFDAEQAALTQAVPAAAVDLAYGPHERHRLDLYGSPGDAPKPVLVFVHGGGFLRGDKGGSGAETWPNAAVGRMAAQAGMIGAVINYRLAPDHMWPAGSEDVLAAFDWLVAHVADHGGDPQRIVLVGTSAGAVHVAGAIRLRPDLAARGAVLLSGLYGHTPLDERDQLYYGNAPDYDGRAPREAMAATTLPLLVAIAEFDPPRFQAEFLGQMADRLARHGTMPRGYIASGHNHYSMAMHLGTSDRRLADEIIAFVHAICA